MAGRAWLDGATIDSAARRRDDRIEEVSQRETIGRPRAAQGQSATPTFVRRMEEVASIADARGHGTRFAAKTTGPCPQYPSKPPPGPTGVISALGLGGHCRPVHTAPYMSYAAVSRQRDVPHSLEQNGGPGCQRRACSSVPSFSVTHSLHSKSFPRRFPSVRGFCTESSYEAHNRDLRYRCTCSRDCRWSVSGSCPNTHPRSPSSHQTWHRHRIRHLPMENDVLSGLLALRMFTITAVTQTTQVVARRNRWSISL